MSCDSVLKTIPLYFYGELTPAEEERVEQHLHECAACAREMERQRAMAAMLDRRLHTCSLPRLAGLPPEAPALATVAAFGLAKWIGRG